MKFLISFVANENAATAIEYALIAALVGIAGITAFALTGTSIVDAYVGIESNFCSAVIC